MERLSCASPAEQHGRRLSVPYAWFRKRKKKKIKEEEKEDENKSYKTPWF
jgi:hypothetical protein